MVLGILGNWDALLSCVLEAWVYIFQALTFSGVRLEALNTYVGGLGTWNGARFMKTKKLKNKSKGQFFFAPYFIKYLVKIQYNI